MPTENYNWTIPYYIYCTVIGMSVLSTLLAIRKHKREDIINIVIIAICIFMISCEALWRILPSLFYNIQFSWRLELILAVFISILAPKFLEKLNKKAVFIGVTILCIIPSLFLINKLSNRIHHKDNTIIELEKGTGNLSEYYPNAYAYDKKYYQNKKGIDIIEGTGEIQITENEAKRLEFKVEESKDLILELPRIYYKGYTLEKEGKKVEIKENQYGLITLSAEDGSYTLKYTGTLAYNITNVIRIIGVISGMIVIIVVKISKKDKNEIVDKSFTS